MTDRSTTLLIAAAATAIVTVSAAAVVWNDRAVQARARDAAGPAAWTVTAAEVYGRDHAVFLDPRSRWSTERSGFITTDDTVVTMLGLRNYETGLLEGVTLAGLATADGDVRWRAPVDGTAECSATAVDGSLLCQVHSSETLEATLITVAVGTGEITEAATYWSILAIVADDDATYVLEGNPEDNDLRLHKGTPDDPDGSWTSAVDMGTAYESVYESRLLRVGDGAVVLDLGGESTGFDIDTGATTWTRSLPECGEALDPTLGGVATRIRKECSTSRILSSELIAPDGKVLATTEAEVAHHLDLDRPADVTVPVLLGDSAYDRETGGKLWSSADLVSAPAPDVGYGAPDTTFGTGAAILDDVALLRDSVGQTEGGLDLRTGERLWERPISSSSSVVAAFGTVAVASYDDALVGVDIRTGDEVWRITLDEFRSETDPFATASGTVGQAGDRVFFGTADRLGGFRHP